MQIVAFGAHDIYLTGNPLITYFKAIYRRHTNFSMESIQNTFQTTPTFGGKVSAVISRNGDLMTNAYLQAELPDVTEKGLHDYGITTNGYDMPHRRYTRWIDNIGHYLIKTVDIEIGGQLIDRHYSDWLEIWAQLTVPASQMKGYREMIGQDPYNIFGQNTGLQADIFRTSSLNSTTEPSMLPGYSRSEANVLVGREIYIPLQFWFCRDYGMALPLIALQHHEVKINVAFREAHELIMTYRADYAEVGGTWVTTNIAHDGYVSHSELDVSLWIDYVYLDTDERRKFAQVSHEYLIDQLQMQQDTVISGSDTDPKLNNVDLYFQHPVKELVWVCKGFDNGREWSNFTNTQVNIKPPLSSVAIPISGFPVPAPGLSGLPSGLQSAPDFDIDMSYLVTQLSGATISAGTELTVVDTDASLSNSTIYFVVNNTSLVFRAGDLVVIGFGSTLLSLIVSETDTNNMPSKFRTVDAITSSYALYTFVSIIDHSGMDSTVNSNGITTFDNPSLSNILTRTDLLNFASYNNTRPYNRKGMAGNPVIHSKLLINNFERIERKEGVYFNRYQCHRHHTNIPESPGINVYSFALKPEDHQPSGTCNFSRLDRFRLIIWLGNIYDGGANGIEKTQGQEMTVSVYAKSYNILRIMSGMAGLSYN